MNQICLEVDQESITQISDKLFKKQLISYINPLVLTSLYYTVHFADATYNNLLLTLLSICRSLSRACSVELKVWILQLCAVLRCNSPMSTAIVWGLFFGSLVRVLICKNMMVSKILAQKQGQLQSFNNIVIRYT